MAELVGRRDELERLDAFLSAPSDAPHVLAVVAEAGMGKTTVWNRGLEVAAGLGYRILCCSPAGSEATLAYSGLGDLVREVVEDVLDELPPPQRDALGAALLLTDSARPASGHAVAVAFLNVLRSLSREGPVLIAVDDLQWLDATSSGVLEYAARRLQNEPVKVFVAMRRSLGSEGARLVEAVRDDEVATLPLPALSSAETHELILDRLGVALSRSQFLSAHEASAGNPFYALEIARTLVREERRDARRVPMPKTLEELLGNRIAALPAATRELLLLASALSEPTLVKLAAARESEVTDDLEPALRANVVDLDGARVRFTHPLLAAAVYGGASPVARQRMHRKLATVVDDEEERARHLALGADGPARPIAEALEQAAARAAERGASRAAAELAELAIELTPARDADDRARRQLAAGIYAWHAGDGLRARSAFERLAAELPPGAMRSDALLHLAFTREDDDAAVAHFCRLALEDARDDPYRSSEIGRVLGFVSLVMGDLDAALEHGATAVAAAVESGDKSQLAGSLSFDAFFRRHAGRGWSDELAQALELERDLDDMLQIYSPTIVEGMTLMYDGEFAQARTRFAAAAATIEQQGNEIAHTQLLIHLCELEWRAGDWQLAADYARDGLELTQQLGAKQSESTMLYCTALVDTGLGRADEARQSARAGALLASEAHDFLYRTQNESVLGLLELSEGGFRRAADRLSPLLDQLIASGWREPTLFGSLWPDAIESLVRDGRLDEASAYLDHFAMLVDDRPTRFGRGALARCHALLSGAEGDLAGAIAHAAAALTEHADAEQPLEHARTLLVSGMIDRRAKRRREARALLGQSLSMAESLGARLWAERAREELGRIGGRASPVDELTPTERRIAALAASGETNREIAEATFLTRKTVEANLSRVYRKLGVASRAELRRRWSEDPSPVGGIEQS
jgi:DNA-binding CsgD family transcriptional regulator